MFRFVSIFFIFVFSIDCFATIYTVTNNNTSGTGSLQSALGLAVSGDTIQFNNGIGNITLTTNNTINGITFTAPSNQIVYANPSSGSTFTVQTNPCVFQNVSLLTSSSSNSGLNLNANITINADSSVLTYSSIIQGSSAVNKTGTKALFLSNSGNNFGNLNIANGSVSIANSGNLGQAGSVNFTGNSSLVFTGTVSTNKAFAVSNGITGTISVAAGQTFIPGAFSGSGNVAITGAGAVNFINAPSFTGSLIQSAGTINLGSNLTTTTVNLNGGIFNVNSSGAFAPATTVNMAGSSTLNINTNTTVGILSSSAVTPVTSIAGGNTLTVNGTGAYAYSGVISGAGALAYSGNGTFTLSNSSNSYSGGTNIESGTLKITSPSLGPGNVNMAGGTLEAAATCTLSNPFTFSSNSSINVDSGQTLSLTGVFNTNSNEIALVGLGTLLMNNSANNNSIGLINFLSGTYALSDSNDIPVGNIEAGGGQTLKFLRSFEANFGNLVLYSPLNIEVVDGVTCTAKGLIEEGTQGVGFTKTGNGTLTLDGSNTFTGALTQSAGTINLGSSLTTTTVNLNGGTFNVNSSGTFATATTLTMTGTSTLNVNTNSTLGLLNSSATTPTVSISNGKTLTINGASSSYAGVVSGAGALAYSGNGTFTLNNSSNNYSGGTTIAAGNISISNSSLGTGPIIFNGGILNVTGSTPFSIPNNFNLTSSAGTISVASGQIMTLGGAISGSNNLTLNGAGTLALTQSSPSYSGQTIINAGVLAISNASFGTGNIIFFNGAIQAIGSVPFTLANNIQLQGQGNIAVISSNQIVTLSGTVNGSGESIIKTGSGKLILTNPNYSYSGLEIEQGVLSVNDINQLGGGVALNGSSPTLEIAANITSSDLIINFQTAGNLSVDDGFNFTHQSSGLMLGSGTITKIGSGTLTLNGNNTFTGSLIQSAGTINLGSSLATTTVNLNGGIFNVNSNGAFAANTTVNMAGSSQLTNTIAQTTLATLNMADTGTLNVYATTTVNSLTATATTPTINFGNVPGRFINIGGGVFGGLITGTGWFNVNAPSGTVTITNPLNNFTQGINIIDGTLKIPCASLGGEEVEFYTGSGTPKLQAYGTTPFTLANNIVLSKTGIFLVDTGQTMTLTGQITGSNPLYKYNAGTLVLNNSANSFSGINLNGGTVAVGYAGDVNGGVIFSSSSTLEIFKTVNSNGNITMTSAGIISIDNGVTYTCAGTIGGAGNISKTGNGNLVAAGTNSYTGSLTIQQGTVNFMSTPGSANIILGGGGLYFSPSSNFTWNNQITGNGAFYKAGSANVTVNGAQSYTGPLYVNSGSLIVNSGSFPNVTNTQIAAGATLQLNANFTVNQPSGSGTIAVGSNTLTIDCESASSFTGAITGSGTIDKSGVGSIELTQDNAVTSVTNHTGTFIANNKMLAANVHNIGTWKGNSSVSSFTNDGVLAPGNSIGAQVITGNFTTNSGSTVEIEYNDVGNSDLIQVTGLADIVPGAQLKLIALPGNQFEEGQEYTFLTANSFTEQVFTNIIVENEADPFLHPIEMVYTPTSIGFVLGVAPYTQRDGYLVSLPSALANQIALGQVDAISNQLYMDVLSDIANNKENPCGFKTKEKRKIFSVVNVRSGNIKENQWNIANEFSITSGLVGVHLNNENNLSGGFGGGYTFGKTHGTNQNVKLYSNTIKLFGYFQTPCMKYFIVDGILAQDFSYYLGSRINVADNKARSSFFGMQTLAQIRAMIEAKIRSYVFMPLIAARYQYFYSGSYKESGAFTDNKQVGADHQNLLYAEAGFNLCHPFYLKYGQIVPQVGFSYLLQTLDDQRTVEVKNYKGSWAQNHPIYAVEKNIYKFNGGVEFVRKDSTIYLNADYIVADLYEYTYDVRAGVQFKF